MTDAVRPDRALLQALERLLELGIIPDVGPALRRSSNQVDSVLLILGLAVSLVGAGVTASSVVIDEKTADQLAAMKWGANSQLKQALLDQSHAARNGLILIAFGSALQMGGVVWQTVKGRRVEAPGMIPREQKLAPALREDIDLYSTDQLRRLYHGADGGSIRLRNTVAKRDEVVAEIRLRVHRDEVRFWLLASMAFIAAVAGCISVVLGALALRHWWRGPAHDPDRDLYGGLRGDLRPIASRRRRLRARAERAGGKSDLARGEDRRSAFGDAGQGRELQQRDPEAAGGGAGA